MADRLAQIFGTEKDKVNCPFYFKIGACRHGDRCSRVHNKPSLSQTLIFHNMYVNPTSVAVAVDGGSLEVDDTEAQQHFDEFYEDVWSELGNFGEIEEMHVTANLGDHLSGNLYVKYGREEEAVAAITKLQGRFYAGRPILGEFSPVTDFREARCRQYDVGECTRGGFCNFIHECKPTKDLVRDLYRRQRRKYRKSGSRSRSRSPRRDRRDRSRSPRRNDRDNRDRDRGDRDRGDRRDRDRGDRGDRDRDRDRDRRDRDRDGDRPRDRDGDRDRRDRDRDGDRDRNRDRDRDRDGNGNRDRDRRDDDRNRDRGSTTNNEENREPAVAPTSAEADYEQLLAAIKTVNE